MQEKVRSFLQFLATFRSAVLKYMTEHFGIFMQIKRLEVLLQKCKETIQSGKERATQLSNDKESLQKSLEWKEQEMAKVKDVHKETLARLQGQLKDTRNKLEEVETRSALQVAEAKQQVHAAIEGKDAELATLRSSVTSLKSENGELGEKIRELEKKCEKIAKTCG